MQYWDGERKFRPQRPDKTTANHRQKRKGKRLSKRIGTKAMRRKFKTDLEATTTQSLMRLYGGYCEGPEFGGDITEIQIDARLLRDKPAREFYRTRRYEDVWNLAWYRKWS